MWTMAEVEEGRRLKRDSPAAAAVGEEEGLELDDEEAEEVGEE